MDLGCQIHVLRLKHVVPRSELDQFSLVQSSPCSDIKAHEQHRRGQTTFLVRALPLSKHDSSTYVNMTSSATILLLVLNLSKIITALHDGVGLKPHMGWSSWVRNLLVMYPMIWHDASDVSTTKCIILRMSHNATRRRPAMPLAQQPSSSRSASRISDTSVSCNLRSPLQPTLRHSPKTGGEKGSARS